ncbi:hypothetical protein LguiA_033760 [Lonicera macranthoides]
MATLMSDIILNTKDNQYKSMMKNLNYWLNSTFIRYTHRATTTACETIVEDANLYKQQCVSKLKRYIGNFCDSKCGVRCSKAKLKDRCLKYCGICCAACHCVPSGTYGNKYELLNADKVRTLTTTHVKTSDRVRTLPTHVKSGRSYHLS